ncbi:major cardiolipin synthase ClsA [Geobacter sp. OR-1]|uniref:cardiolipin synthase n=1 Tax=Geobacter sp. OR-1 TaxID=1266765 RepID=UPI00054299F3|nr:cardiolipin synthase [Geobacter sp. OR-1]GAM09199.1 major cardiolipin synthase ClsA [Geobacter sp. OR-1]
MDHLFWTILIGAATILSLVGGGHALLFKRDPRSALGWIVVCLTLPFAGPVLYWAMGVNRIHRRARQWLESGRRVAGWDRFASTPEIPRAFSLPENAIHLNELMILADRVVIAPLIEGNRLTPLVNGDAAYPEMLEAIRGSQRSVHISTYIFDADRVGRTFVDALIQAASRGVDVRLIVDSLGEKYSRPLVRGLFKGTKVKLGRFLPLRYGGYVNLRTHRKILVVDGAVAFTGGMNIGGRHMVEIPECNLPVADMHFMVEGPIVAYLQRVFLEDWYFVAKELVSAPDFFPRLEAKGAALVRSVSDGPDKEFRKLHWLIMGGVSCARKSVRIMTPYFIPDRALISSLVTAAMRGVEVTLVLPEINNLPFVHWASRAYLWEILQHGVKVYYQPPPFVHTKLFLVDDIWALIGSANLDPRSLRLNFELNLEVYDTELAATLASHFANAVSISREETLDAVDGRPMFEKIRDCIAKLFSPYL